MDRLFKKRTASAETTSRPATLRKFPSSNAVNGSEAGKLSGAMKDNGVKASQEWGDGVPCLDVDIRNSLMLPGLLEQFSVLLPSLSTAPETSLRSMLASQRARLDGPSLTLEEEELFLAELRSTPTKSGRKESEWNGRPAGSDHEWHKGGYTNSQNTPDSLPSNSASSPSFLSSSTGTSPTGDTSASSPFWSDSSPPTSTSVGSFQTFGAHGEDNNNVKIKSYGFSGGSGMRDGEYIRKVKKSASGRYLSKMEGTPTKQTEVPLPRISPEKANTRSAGSHWHVRSDSPCSESDSSATPTSSLCFSPASVLPIRTPSPSATAALRFPLKPPNSTPLSPLTTDPSGQEHANGRPQKRRQSLLSGLSPAQMKRISSALGEIEGKLRHTSRGINGLVEEEIVNEEEEEDQEETLQSQGHETVRAPLEYSARAPKASGTKANSPATLPPSPRSRNLFAHVEAESHPATSGQSILLRASSDEPNVSIPRPILTPARTQPIRHLLSASSVSSTVHGSPVPLYVPGQPRPIGSLHRPDSSTSSRAVTPTHQPGPRGLLSPSPGASASPVFHARSSSHPSPMIPQVSAASRASSLARSVSASQAAGLSEGHDYGLGPAIGSSTGVFASARTAHLSTEPTLSPGLGTSSSIPTPPPGETIEEGDESSEADDLEPSEADHEMPEIKAVRGRRSVAESHSESRSDSARARGALGWGLASNMKEPGRVISEKGTIEGSFDDSDSPIHHSQTITVRPKWSDDSLDSGFAEPQSDEPLWDEVFGGSSPASPLTPELEPGQEVEMLRKMSGVGRQEMAALQEKLVERAKTEREALRTAMDDSPLLPYLGAMPVATNPVKSAAPSRGLLPSSPTIARPAAPSPLVTREIVPDSPPLHQIGTAMSRGLAPASVASSFEVLPTGLSAVTVDPRMNAPPTLAQSTETPYKKIDEVVTTPSADKLSHQRSRRVPPEDDPEVRREYEARIAAATAALNRTPSAGPGLHLERKTTKRGAMVISGPKLMSSSTALTATPSTPPSVVSIIPRSGSGKKSLRWKTFGFRKGQSISGEDSTTPPVASASPGLSSVPQSRLEEPIALHPVDEISTELNAFRFPPNSASATVGTESAAQVDPAALVEPVLLPSPPGTANPTTGLKQIMGKFRRGRSDERPYDATPGQHHTEPPPSSSLAKGHTGQTAPAVDLVKLLKEAQHSPSSSEDTVVAKFVEAGRALGHTSEQLNEMLARKGMLNRSGTSGSSESHQSTTATTASVTHSTPSPASPSIVQVLSTDDGKKGLFRSLSRGKKAQRATPSVSAPPAEADGSPSRNVVVRRTLLITSDAIPDTPDVPAYPTPIITFDSQSPDPNAGRFGNNQRKLSVKRKPINLSREDLELVSNSPRTHRRKSSVVTTASGKSDGGNEPAGLGFLHPNLPVGQANGSAHSTPASTRGSSIRKSSGGGSFYELYNNNEGQGGPQGLHHPSAQEDERRTSQLSASSAQAVEICEYADGQVVWSIVDGLRSGAAGHMESEAEQEIVFDNHYRSTSYDSSKRESAANGTEDVFGNWGRNGSGAGTQALNLRHRNKSATNATRPETDVYFTSSADVADLIDHLSSDLNSSRGRIDILPTPLEARSPRTPLVSSNATTSDPSPKPQNEDTASSRRPAPPPISSPRLTAGVPASGFSPKRQMFVRQGFGSTGGPMHSNPSPSAASFASSSSGQPGKTVEDRLQALLDRLQDGTTVG